MSDAPPSHLSARSKALWRSIVAGYVLEVWQLELLRRACEASDRADQARKVLKAEGLTYRDTHNRPKTHPAVAIERDARLATARLLRELALEPAPEAPRPPPL